VVTLQPKSYQFGYAVKDYATGTDYNRHESSDGNTIQGEYRVQLPDGRTQIVTYIADWKNGYRAQVRYEGEAHYPDVSYNTGGGYGESAPGYTGASFGPSGHGGSSSYGPPGYH
jgi:Insect cuticle protein.